MSLSRIPPSGDGISGQQHLAVKAQQMSERSGRRAGDLRLGSGMLSEARPDTLIPDWDGFV